MPRYSDLGACADSHPTTVGIAVTNAIFYSAFNESRSLVLRAKKTNRGTLTTLDSILVSAIAGAATSILSNPIWVVNTRQTVRTTVLADSALPTANSPKAVVEKKLNVLQTILHILRTDGFWAFFHGLGPALILVSNPILQFTVSSALAFMSPRHSLTLHAVDSYLNSSRTSSWLVAAFALLPRVQRRPRCRISTSSSSAALASCSPPPSPTPVRFID